MLVLTTLLRGGWTIDLFIIHHINIISRSFELDPEDPEDKDDDSGYMRVDLEIFISKRITCPTDG